MTRCYVIGDVHGCPAELAALVESLPLESEDTLVFLGDYIDRGPDSRGVVDLLVGLGNERKTVFLRGNHEDMMLSFMGLSGRHGDAFLMNGGIETLAETVLFGHTPMKDVFFDLPYKIGLDTGLVYGNALSCLEVADRTLYQIRRGSRRVSVTQVGRHWGR